MITYLTNYLDLFDYTFKNTRLTFPFDFFSKDEINKAAEEHGLSDKQRDALLFSLKTLKDTLRKDESILYYFMEVSPTLAQHLDDLLKTKLNKEKQASLAEDLAKELRSCIMAQVAPIVNAEWDNSSNTQNMTPEMSFKKQMIQSFLPSYMSYIASIWREVLELQEWKVSAQEKNLRLLLLTLMEHHNDLYDPFLEKKLKKELLITMETINYATDSPVMARANGKKVVHDLSDQYNRKSDQEVISALKQRINSAGISSQSVPVIWSLVGYYLGAKKHKTKITVTQYDVEEEAHSEEEPVYMKPLEKESTEKEKEKKSSYFSSLFTRKSHKHSEKHEPASNKKIKI